MVLFVMTGEFSGDAESTLPEASARNAVVSAVMVLGEGGLDNLGLETSGLGSRSALSVLGSLGLGI